jgi:hypothetical protein
MMPRKPLASDTQLIRADLQPSDKTPAPKDAHKVRKAAKKD